MHSKPLETPRGSFTYAGEHLRRHETTGIYYAFVKKGRKQFRRSLKTTDKPLAKRRLVDLLDDFARLMPAEAANLTFEQIAAQWLANTRHTVKASTVIRRQTCLKAVTPFLSGIPLRNIAARHCQAWLTQRVTKSGKAIAAQTFAHELETMRAVFKYAMEMGWILRDPTSGIKRRRIVNKKSNVPNREQLAAVVAGIRAEPRERGGADLVELLAYSGMRLHEATALRWRDVNFAQGVFTVTGGEVGTKNHEQRTVPLSDEMRALLEGIKRTRDTASAAFVIQIASAKKCLETTCRKLGLPKFHHHSLRHYFATCAIESGVDIPTVARWAGHKDGGALLMKTYAHLQQAHSVEQMKRVSFSTMPPREAIEKSVKADMAAIRADRENGKLIPL